jgi:hypothetical protein
MMRTVLLSLTAASVLVTGCLFPSFDGMQKSEQQPGIAVRGEQNATSGEGTDAASSNDAGASSDSGSGTTTTTTTTTTTNAADAGVDAGERTIACGPSTCPFGAGSFCCAGYGSCGAADGQFACSNLGGGRVLECDDNDDCGGTQVCCYVEANMKASCQLNCGTGAILCNAGSPRCPGKMQCNGTLTTASFTTSRCQ